MHGGKSAVDTKQNLKDMGARQMEEQRASQGMVGYVVAVVLGLAVWFAVQVYFYSNQRTALQHRAQTVREAQRVLLADLGSRSADSRLRGLGNLLKQRAELERFDLEAQAHVEKSDAIRQAILGPTPDLSFVAADEEDIARNLSTIQRLYMGTTDALLIEFLNKLKGSDTRTKLMIAANFLRDGLVAISDSANSFAAPHRIPVRANVGSSISIAPFRGKKKRIVRVVQELSRRFVLVVTAELKGKLRQALIPAGAEQSVMRSREALASLAAVTADAQTLANIGVDRKYLANIEKQVNAVGAALKRIMQWVRVSLQAESKSHELLIESLATAQSANQLTREMGEYDQSGKIQEVLDLWWEAAGQANNGAAALAVNPPSGLKPMTDFLLKDALRAAHTISSKIAAHRRFVSEKYEAALQQESSWHGRATRGLGRGLSALARFGKDTAASIGRSRVGREVGLSYKMLILGTKAYFDLLDPDADPAAWAFRYSDDMEQLMAETDEVMRMEGPSLTGKNTLIESLVDSAYESNFSNGRK